MSADPGCFLGALSHIAKYAAKNCRIWRKNTHSKSLGRVHPAKPAKKPMAGFFSKWRKIRQITWRLFDSSKGNINKTQELPFRSKTAKDNNNKHSKLVGFFHKILTPDGKSKQVTLCTKVKTTTKILRQLEFCARRGLTDSKWPNYQRWQKPEPNIKKMKVFQQKKMNTKSKPVMTSPWSPYPAGTLTVIEIYQNYSRENIRSKLIFYEFSELSDFQKFQETLIFFTAKGNKPNHSDKTTKPQEFNGFKAEMRFQLSIKIEFFMKFGKVIKPNRRGLQSKRLDPRSNPMKDKNIQNKIVSDNRNFSRYLILIIPYDIIITELLELQFPTADELIAGAEQSMEITPEDVTNEAKRGEARSIKIPEVDKSVDGEGMIKFPEVDKTVKGDAKIKVPEVDKTVTGDVRNENDREDLDAEENCVLTEAEAEEDEKSSWLVRFPSGYPPYPTTTPTEQAYWMKVFEDREARLAKEESEEETMSESASQTTTQSKRPAALPKPMGRCTEGNLCDNLLAHSCIFDTDTASAMSMKSADESSVTCYGLSREGEERPTTPPPHQDFRLDDLNLVVGDHLVHYNNAPSIIWTNASVLSTLASVLDTEASVIETLPSIISTEASVQFLDEIDPMLLVCQCGTKISAQEKEATLEYSKQHPAPYICFDCRWKSVGL